MTKTEFNSLSKREKLTLVHFQSKELDDIFPWTGELRIVTLYNLFDLIVEVVCNLVGKEKGITEVTAYNSYDILLEKYPHHFDKFKREVLYNLIK